MNPRVALLVLAIALALTLFAACSGDDAPSTVTPTATGSGATPSATSNPETPTATSSSTASATPSSTPSPTPSPSPTPTPSPTPEPTPPAGKLAMKVLNYSTPVTPGQQAFVTLLTEPGARCSVKLEYSAEAEVGPARLQEKAADGEGLVDWTWKVRQDRPLTVQATANCKTDAAFGNRQFVIEIITE